jgi:hypothetical protein
MQAGAAKAAAGNTRTKQLVWLTRKATAYGTRNGIIVMKSGAGTTTTNQRAKVKAVIGEQEEAGVMKKAAGIIKTARPVQQIRIASGTMITIIATN